MSSVVSFNGSSFIIPSTGEVGWGSNVSNYLIAIAAGCLQKTGGSFTLSAETDFGASYGLKSLYYKSRSSSVASTGILRLANNSDAVSWRNFLGNGDLPLAVNASNQLTFNGTAIGGAGIFTASRAIVSDGSGNLAVATTTATEIGYVNGVTSAIQTQLDAKQTTTLTSGNILVGNVSNVATSLAMSGDITITNAGVTAIGAGKIVNAQVNASAAIAYSKLNLTGGIVNADINASAAIAYSKLNLALSIVNADVSTSAAIAYSKLNLTGSIVNADVNASAAIAYSKLNLSASIVNADISSSAAIAITKIANGTANQVLGTNAGASANEWKTLTATSNQVSVTHGVGTVTFATPQDIGTGSAVRFGSLTLGGSLDASAILSLISTSKGFLPPVMTTTQKNAISSPTDGLIVYDSSLAQLYLRAGSAWTPLSTGGGSGTVSSGTAGRLTLYAASGTTVTDTYVQNSQNIVLAIATQASRSAGLTVTIPNPGNAVTAANILLSEGAQTINGAQTFTGVVKISDGVVGTPALTLSDPTTGLFSQLAGQLAITSGGSRSASFFTTSVRLGVSPWEIVGTSTAWNPAVDNSLTLGASAARWSNVYSVLGNFSGQVSLDGAAGNPIHGTNTNDSAAAGYVGETMLGNQTTFTNFPTSTQWGDLTSVTLTAGDWLVWGTYQMLNNGGTTTEFSIAVTSTSGNSTTGFTNGLNNFSYRAASLTSTNEGQLTVPAVRFSLTGSTVVYLKYEATWSTTAPQASGNIRALRIR